jgi:hypothetical protein
MKTAMVLLCVCFCAGTVYGQNFRHPVEIMETAPDTVGSRLAYQVKENIQKSASMRLTYEKEVRLQMFLVTLDPYANKPGAGISTVYSVVYAWMNPQQPILMLGPIFMRQFVGTCGTSYLKECAEIITAKAYEQFEVMFKINSAYIDEAREKAEQARNRK